MTSQRVSVPLWTDIARFIVDSYKRHAGDISQSVSELLKINARLRRYKRLVWPDLNDEEWTYVVRFVHGLVAIGHSRETIGSMLADNIETVLAAGEELAMTEASKQIEQELSAFAEL